ncbi:hypothetical protein J6D24_02375 [Candidatus Saccharibacteria bacterium]|nr:hypothetical protein [Candidatus Saccharibacteria bacterium]MBQ3271095.1 hypothetical protein [Candidatus Saccharibacteria bacterium]MBR0416151.1 hypothetical protein [Candidatus Saccharibacteria bacterium]
MFLVDLFSWWYFRGWGVFFEDFKKRLVDTVDFFSMKDMILTLFKPYRQIAAGASETILGGALDRLISRMVGFFARVVILIAGCFVLILEVFCGIALVIVWPIVPLLPVAGIILSVMGVVF